MMGTGSKDEQYDVSDSTDWLGTPLAGLAPVDAALRCQVCKDFYKTPMITSCSHTFCSLCIRRCLANDGKCPACRATEQENKLRSNWSIEGLVDDFLRARSTILAHARNQSTYGKCPSPKRKVEEAYLDGEGQDEPRKRTRSSNQLSTRSGGRNNVLAPDEDDDGDYQPVDGLAACPVCSARMKVQSIDAHLNTCLDEFSGRGRSTFQSASRSSALAPNITTEKMTSNKIERLPHLNYSLFKEAALRKKLQELGISGQGNRQLLERRHTEWVTLWNANCDASRPRKKAELLHELDLWERTQGGRATSSSSGIITGSHILHKDFDGAGWRAKHDQSFHDLIAKARKNLGGLEYKPQPAGKSDPNPSMERESPGRSMIEGRASSDASAATAMPASRWHPSALSHDFFDVHQELPIPSEDSSTNKDVAVANKVLLPPNSIRLPTSPHRRMFGDDGSTTSGLPRI